jgi:hypothetical protein
MNEEAAIISGEGHDIEGAKMLLATGFGKAFS